YTGIANHQIITMVRGVTVRNTDGSLWITVLYCIIEQVVDQWKYKIRIVGLKDTISFYAKIYLFFVSLNLIFEFCHDLKYQFLHINFFLHEVLVILDS